MVAMGRFELPIPLYQSGAFTRLGYIARVFLRWASNPRLSTEIIERARHDTPLRNMYAGLRESRAVP